MNFEKPKQFLKVAALVFLTSLPAFAQTKDAKAGELKQLAKDRENKIVLQMAERGQKGKFGNMDVKRIALSDGSQVIVGYDKNGKEQWIIKESGDGSNLHLDENLDGEVDRFVLNKEERGSVGEKTAFNELKAFTSIDQLSMQAKMEADLDPEKVFVYKVERGPEGYTIKAVSFSTGETEELTGAKAEEYQKKLQAMFADALK